MKHRLFILTMVFAAHTATASAHYLWLRVDGEGGKFGRANLYFEEGPAPGDGKYLPPIIKRGKMWIRTPSNPKPQMLKMMSVKPAKNRHWLAADLSTGGARAIDAFVQWGVYKYGKIHVLLHYTARTMTVNKSSDLDKLARSNHLDMDIIPSVEGKNVQLQVIWKGKPVAGRPVYVRGLKGTLTTDAKGMVKFTAGNPKFYAVRTFVDDVTKGTFEGMDYDRKRFHCSLSLRVPLSGK